MERNSFSWQEIPEKYFSNWSNIFSNSVEGMNLDIPCPICGNIGLHRYYITEQEKEIFLGGNRFVGTGLLWEWCSSCGNYAKYSAAIPDWWNSHFKTDLAKLDLIPEDLQNSIGIESSEALED